MNRRATFPAEINNALAGPLSQLQLHVNVQKRHPSGPPYGLYVAFPTIMHSNLVSLNLMSRALESQPASYIDQLRNLVVRSTKLETYTTTTQPLHPGLLGLWLSVEIWSL